MRQRKGERKEESSETLKMETKEEEEEEEGNKKGFYACYLLVSLSPRHKGHTYIGFTVNPRRRIRQHNGEIGCGAWRTKKRRPWEMVLCIHGFPSNISALQFEWAWQHPHESLAVRKAAASFKSLSGIANKIKLAYTMLTLPSWQSLNMTVNYFSTKYTKHSAGCPSLPGHMKVRIRPMDELPCYVQGKESFSGDENEWGDGNWEEEASIVCEASKETSSSSVFENSEERDKSSLDEASNDRGKDSREGSRFCEFLGIPSSPNEEASNNSFVEEIAEDSGLYALIKDDSFGLKQPTGEQSTAPITLDDDQPPQERRIVPEEIEIIDVTTPSPLCGTSLWGKKRRASTVCPEIIDLTKSPSFVQL